MKAWYANQIYFQNILKLIFFSLQTAKYEALKKEIEAVEKSLAEASKKPSKAADEDVDDLDAYINSLKTEETAPKKSAAVLRVCLSL